MLMFLSYWMYVYMIVGLKTANKLVASLERKVNILEEEQVEKSVGKYRQNYMYIACLVFTVLFLLIIMTNG